MSASDKFNPIKFIDKLMSDGKRRSERQMLKALLAAYTDQAAQDLKAWVASRNTDVDQGLRWEEKGPLNGKTDRWGEPTRYGYWRVEQDPDKIAPGDPMERLPTREQAREMAKAEAQAYETAEKARSARRAGVLED
jgi:hypothetical protein